MPNGGNGEARCVSCGRVWLIINIADAEIGRPACLSHHAHDSGYAGRWVADEAGCALELLCFDCRPPSLGERTRWRGRPFMFRGPFRSESPLR